MNGYGFPDGLGIRAEPAGAPAAHGTAWQWQWQWLTHICRPDRCNIVYNIDQCSALEYWQICTIYCNSYESYNTLQKHSKYIWNNVEHNIEQYFQIQETIFCTILCTILSNIDKILIYIYIEIYRHHYYYRVQYEQILCTILQIYYVQYCTISTYVLCTILTNCDSLWQFALTNMKNMLIVNIVHHISQHFLIILSNICTISVSSNILLSIV